MGTSTFKGPLERLVDLAPLAFDAAGFGPAAVVWGMNNQDDPEEHLRSLRLMTDWVHAEDEAAELLRKFCICAADCAEDEGTISSLHKAEEALDRLLNELADSPEAVARRRRVGEIMSSYLKR